MGVLNVTPDSFSDGGAWGDAATAIAHGRALAEAGADLIDVGGESTRPGARDVTAEEEIRRVAPVIETLAGEGITVSVDTSKVGVARAAVEAGAEVVNDVTALGTPEMAAYCAGAGVGVVLMHMQGTPRTMQENPSYDDVVDEVSAFLLDRAAVAVAEGIEGDRIVIDPGIGFGKTVDHNLELLARLDALSTGPYPILVGASRKRFLGSIVQRAGKEPEPTERDPATAATVVAAILAGAAVVRVHDVAATTDAVRVADAIVRVSPI
jgi:dihydropteroate synthase